MARAARAAPPLRARARRHAADAAAAARRRDRRPLLPLLPAHHAAHALRVPRRLGSSPSRRAPRQRRRLLEPGVLVLHAGPPRTVPAHRDDGGDEEAVSIDQETGRDRYFEARDAELAALLDPETGRLAAGLAQTIACPLCGGSTHRPLFEKQGFTFVRCADCRLVFVNQQVREDVVLAQYRTAETNDLWFEVLTSERQLALDREKFADVLDLLEPYKGEGRLLDVGCSIGLFLDLARERGWRGTGIEFAPRALAFARDHYGLDVLDVPLDEAGFAPESFDAVGLLSVLEHTNEPRRMLGDVARVLRPGGAVYVVVPNIESLACRVLHERARTFDGRNHLVYFSPSTLTDALDRAGFDAVHVTTKVASFGPVAEHLAYEEPYSDADLSADVPGEILAALEPRLADLHLGYKLHA